MKVFIDSSSSQKPIKITIGVCERIQAFAGVDILSGNPTELARLFDEPITLSKAIVAAVNQEGFTLEELDAVTFANAKKAFFEELADFFRILGRTDLTTMLARMGEIAEKAMAEREKVIQTKFAAPSFKQPEASESTPVS